MSGAKQPILPPSIINRADVARLSRELEALESAIRQAAVGRHKDDKLLPSSRLLDELAESNKLNLLQPTDRLVLKKFLEDTRTHAPVMHFNFSVDPSPRFLSSLIAWLRREIDPLVLVQVGLEPALGAGCVVRTNSRYFDFSLHHYIDGQRELLVSKLRSAQA